MALSKDQIVAAINERAAQLEKLPVPEWGGDVFVRRLTADDVDRVGLDNKTRDAGMFGRVIAAALTDEDGTPLFNRKDAGELAKADIATTARVFAEIMRVNGLMDADLEAAIASFSNAQPEPSSSE